MLKYLMLISFCFTVSKSVLEYGEFDIKLIEAGTCNGPKRRSCVDTSVKIVKDIVIDFDMIVKEDMKTIKGKIIGSLGEKELLRMQIKNLCDHIFLKPIILATLNSTDNCEIRKGRYRFNLDIQMIARKFYGGKFMYGNWTIKWVFHNDHCNMQCIRLYLSMMPKASIGDK